MVFEADLSVLRMELDKEVLQAPFCSVSILMGYYRCYGNLMLVVLLVICTLVRWLIRR